MNNAHLISAIITLFILWCLFKYVLNVPALYSKYRHNRRSGFNRVRSLVIAWKWLL